MDLYNLLTSPLGLPLDNALIEWIILLVIEFFAGRIAYRATSGGKFGHEKWWIAKLMFHIIIWAILYGLIWLAKLLIQNWVLIVFVISIFLVISNVVWFILRHRKKGLKENAEN